MALGLGRLMKVAASAAFSFLMLAASASGQVVVKVNNDINFRFGLLLQSWADWTQDANSEGYSQNLFLRRIRGLLAASVAKNVSIFYQTDNSRLGNSGTNGNKVFNTGFSTVDAFVEWMLVGDNLMLDGGLFIVPSSRDALTRASNYMAFDIGAFDTLGNVFEQGNQTRDHGFGFHGFLGDERLEYRLAAFDGRRQSLAEAQPAGSAGSRNPYRVAGRLNYDFFDLENGDWIVSRYVYAGTNLGAKRVVAVGAWGDGQGPYRAYGADFMFDWPILKNAVTVEGDYMHFEQDVATPLLPKQNDLHIAAGYYFDAIKLQPYAAFQEQNFSDESRKSGNTRRYGGGLNWYISGNNLKLSFLYERIVPATKPPTAAIKDTNHVAIQLQAYYF